jgi:hypothetical protein
MKMRDPQSTTTYGVMAHQHVNNGGLSMSVSTDTHDDGTETHHLEIGLSNYGVSQRCIIPVFSSTPNLLRLIADELEAKNIRDPKYMSPIIAHVSYDDKDDVYFRVVGGKVVQVKYEDCYGGSGQASQQATSAGTTKEG